MKTIHEKLKETGLEIGQHCGDLYIEVTPVTSKIIDDYEYKENVTCFFNQITKKLSYDIPFASDDYRKG